MRLSIVKYSFRNLSQFSQLARNFLLGVENRRILVSRPVCPVVVMRLFKNFHLGFNNNSYEVQFEVYCHLDITIHSWEGVVHRPIVTTLLLASFHQVGHHHYPPGESSESGESGDSFHQVFSPPWTHFASLSQTILQKSSVVEKSGPWVVSVEDSKFCRGNIIWNELISFNRTEVL